MLLVVAVLKLGVKQIVKTEKGKWNWRRQEKVSFPWNVCNSVHKYLISDMSFYFSLFCPHWGKYFFFFFFYRSCRPFCFFKAGVVSPLSIDSKIFFLFYWVSVVKFYCIDFFFLIWQFVLHWGGLFNYIFYFNFLFDILIITSWISVSKKISNRKKT